MSLTRTITELLLARVKPDLIELGTRWFRLLRGTWQNGTWHLETAAAVPAPRGIIFTSHLPMCIFDEPEISSAILSLYGGNVPRETYVALVLPDQAFHIGTLNLSTVILKANPIAALEREVQNTAPMPLREYMMKFELGMQHGNRSLVPFCALSKPVLAELETVFQNLGIQLLSIQPSFVGMAALWRQLDPSPTAHPVALMHVGNEATTISISSPSGLKRVQLIGVGICDAVSQLAKVVRISLRDAETAILRDLILIDDPTQDAQAEIPAYQALEGVFSTWLHKLYGILQLHAAEIPTDVSFRQIVLSGGGAAWRNFDRFIADNLGLTVVRFETTCASRINAAFSGIEVQGGPQGFIPLLGHLMLQPWQLERLDRVAAA
ncbi:MAG TPA: rod shape-determining protein, partial [Candidatus Ozemobacteraceae bacterium]|nr:rod shape-determining protein [Candidatus Ozemobacteraceae bacterium]